LHPGECGECSIGNHQGLVLGKLSPDPSDS